MRRLLNCFAALLITVFLFNGSAYSANEPYRSVASGNWNSASTWEYSTNGGSIWVTPPVGPSDISGTITVRNPNTVTVAANINADQISIDSGGVVSINAGIILTVLNGTSTDLTLLKGGIVSGSGTLQTQGVGTVLNLRGGSTFSANLKVNTGSTTVADFSSPFTSSLRGNVTIDPSATLNSNNSNSYFLVIYGSITNNGTITGTGGSNLRMLGQSFTNNGSVTQPDIFFDSTTTISGTGTFAGSNIVITDGNVSLLNDVTFSLATEFEVQTGGTFSANGFILTFTSGTFTVLTGGTVVNSGTVRTQNSIFLNPRTGSSFNANLNVVSGTTIAAELSSPYDGRLGGNVTINAGAILSTHNSDSYALHIYGNIINNGTITGTNGANLRFFGASLVNNGTITQYDFYFDSTTTISGTGTFNIPSDIYITDNGNVSLLNDVTFSPLASFEIQTGGTFSPNGFIFTFSSGTFTVLTGGTVVNSGTVRTQNNVSVNPRSGSNFNANVLVASGTTIAAEFSSPYDGRLRGNVTVNAGATLSTHNSDSYALHIYGSITNNGTITGTNGANLRFFGPSFVNNGTVTQYDLFFDSTTSVSGAGLFNIPSNIYITDNGNVSLQSNVTFSPVASFEIQNGGKFSANSFILTFSSGTFTVLSGGTVLNSGTVRTQNNVFVNPRTGSSFNADINVISGTTFAAELSSPYLGRLRGNVTVNNGATLSSYNSNSYNLHIYGNLTNNGTLTGTNGANMTFLGSSLINNGTVSTPDFFFDSISTLSGTGVFTTNMFLLNGAALTMTSNHQFLNVNINAGASFTLGGNTLKFTASNPIIQNGTLNSTGSKVEYNGTAAQDISATNITYHGLRINNAAGTFLLANVNVNDTLAVISGDLDLSGGIITFPTTGYLTETPGNTIKGNAGYIVTTRTINAPSSLNVAGLGAVLTSTANLGSTEIRRGHAVQTTGSIRRYYDITPVNNTGLNATLKFKYDESELNFRPEPTLKLKKSTNSGTNWTLMGGTVNTALNEITIPGQSSFSRWTGDSSGVSAVIGLAIQGFYSASTNRLAMTDTLRIYLRNIVSPYGIVDSAKAELDSATLKAAYVLNTPSGTYYIQTKHRNALETWSKSGGEIHTLGNTLNYDFTTSANKAFGDNQAQVDASPLRFAIYSGDVNQDGGIDLSDIIQVFNSANNFESGYIVTDVNGDSFADLTDITITFNNSNNFISVMRP